MDIIERLLNMCRDIRRKPIPVSGVIPLMQEASAELARLRAEVEALRADAQAVAALLPGPYYMAPPDGGSVTVIEQLRRMAADAARYRWIKRGASFREERDMGPGGCWSIFVAVPRRPAVNSLDTAIDAAMAQGKV